MHERQIYERRKHRLLPWPAFLLRAVRHLLLGAIALGVAVGAGTIGYKVSAGLPWVDSFLNASMILSGMGPVDRMLTTPAKLFAAVCALFSGHRFIGLVGVILAPWVHRLFHWFHVDTE